MNILWLTFFVQDGWTPLMLAVKEDQPKSVQLLIAAKADASAKNNVMTCLMMPWMLWSCEHSRFCHAS